MHKWPTSFQGADSVIIKRETGQLLLARKHNEPLWRFPGGFVDPHDESLESASIREKNEECSINLECSPPQYLFSFRVPDPRYKNSQDQIMSAVFLSFYLWGKEKAGDDIKYVQWFNKDYLRRNYHKTIMPVHVPLVKKLIDLGII